MRPAHLAFLFHMHQPDYVDPATGRAELPWVRLHGSRGYLDLATILDEYPAVHVTVNFVPSLLRQLDEVVRGGTDHWLEVASMPEREWSPGDRLFLLERHFSVHWERCIVPRARYRELLDKRGRDTPAARMRDRIGSFSDEDLRDLTVLFHLSWIGFGARRGDAELAALERKGRGYDLADLALVVDTQRRACAAVLPLWKRLSARGQVELSSSPFYHPIGPLLVDSDHMARAQPDLPRPQRFAYPSDAALQIERGAQAHAQAFGAPPVGMWPPEGSVSPEMVRLYAQAGIRWLATDEGNLWRSRQGAGLSGDRGELYRAHRHAGVDLVFRDRELSDRIGFSYMHGEPDASADDLLGRAWQSAQASLAPDGDPAVVGVFLDGENPWESYVGSGEPFLRAVFERLTRGPLRATTITEHLDEAKQRSELPTLHSGSWIDSDFHIWIGDPVKNRAWDLLGATRRRIEEHAARGRTKEAALALDRVLAAEGSDWFWWFGAPFSSAEDHIFDRLFRTHLEAAYRALGEPPPAALGRPVDDQLHVVGAAGSGYAAPSALIRPAIGDERGVRGYYAWAGAGRIEVPRGAAMAELPMLQRLLFGYDRQRLSLRLEATPGRASELVASTIEVELSHQSSTFRIRVQPHAPEWSLAEAEGDAWTDRGTGRPVERRELEDTSRAVHPTIDVGIDWARIGAGANVEVTVVVRIVRDAVVLARYPGDTGLSVAVPSDDFEADHWSV